MPLTTWFLAAAVLIVVAPAALADSFQFTINSSVQEFISNTGNDNYMGIYTTPSDAWGTQGGVHTGTPYYGNSPFSNISFSVPARQTVTSVAMTLILPYSVEGTADVFFTGGGRLPLHPPDPWGPVSIPAILASSGSSTIEIDGLAASGGPGFNYGHLENGMEIFDISNLLTVNGNELFTTGMGNVRIQARGEVYGHITSQGYNYASYMGGTGQASIPYTLEIVGTYSPVPEPSSFALLGTGVLGLAGLARRKFIFRA